jgi:hypothetical protein
MLAPSDWPSSVVESADALTKWVFAGPASETMVRLSRSVGSENSGSRVNSQGSISARLITMAVVPGLTAASTFLLPATTMSPPMTRSARRAATRIA